MSVPSMRSGSFLRGHHAATIGQKRKHLKCVLLSDETWLVLEECMCSSVSTHVHHHFSFAVRVRIPIGACPGTDACEHKGDVEERNLPQESHHARHLMTQMSCKKHRFQPTPLRGVWHCAWHGSWFEYHNSIVTLTSSSTTVSCCPGDIHESKIKERASRPPGNVDSDVTCGPDRQHIRFVCRGACDQNAHM